MRQRYLEPGLLRIESTGYSYEDLMCYKLDKTLCLLTFDMSCNWQRADNCSLMKGSGLAECKRFTKTSAEPAEHTHATDPHG
jgi:hypothetical protein